VQERNQGFRRVIEPWGRRRSCGRARSPRYWRNTRASSTGSTSTWSRPAKGCARVFECRPLDPGRRPASRKEEPPNLKGTIDRGDRVYPLIVMAAGCADYFAALPCVFSGLPKFQTDLRRPAEGGGPPLPPLTTNLMHFTVQVSRGRRDPGPGVRRKGPANPEQQHDAHHLSADEDSGFSRRRFSP